MNESIIAILLVFIVIGIILGFVFIVDRDKYTHYNVLAPKGKCEWEAAREVCESNGYEFKNVGIFMNSITAKCVFKDIDGEYSKKKTKLTEIELINCTDKQDKQVEVSRWK